MNLVLEIRRGQKEIGQGLGVSSKSIDRHRGSGVLPPLETSLRFHQYSYAPSLLLTGSVFSDLQDNSFSGLFRQCHNLFPQYFCPFILVRLFRDWVFLADGSGANTKQLSISHGGQQFMVSPAGNGSGCILTVYPTIGNNCLVQGKNTYTILRFKQGLISSSLYYRQVTQIYHPIQQGEQ